jgi:hypothetical protein
MKTAKELNLTPTQYKNLAKLTMFVRDKAEPPRFNINSFFSGDGDTHYGMDTCPDISKYQCGTTACFLGYGIPAGIKARKKEDWREYCRRAFGIDMCESWGNVNRVLYELLFAEDHINCKTAAALRGAWVLMNGIPDEVYINLWETPEDFEPDWEAIEKITSK